MFSYQVSVIDKTGTNATAIPQLQTALMAALDQYAQYVNGKGTIKLEINIVAGGPDSSGMDPGIWIASMPRDLLSQISGPRENPTRYVETELVHVLKTGAPATTAYEGTQLLTAPAGAQVVFNVSAAYFDHLFFGSASQIVPADKVDATSRFLTELAQPFGIDPFTARADGWGYVGVSGTESQALRALAGDRFFPISQTTFGRESFALPLYHGDVFDDHRNYDEPLLPGQRYKLSGVDLEMLRAVGLDVPSVTNLPISFAPDHTGWQKLDDGAQKIVASILSDRIDFGGGVDTIVESGTRASHEVRAFSDGSIGVRDAASGSWDLFANVERIRFDDGVLIVDQRSQILTVYRMYQAAFGRVPDEAGFAVQIDAFWGHTSYPKFGQNFVASAEFKARYGDNPSDEAFVLALYRNVLGRDADPAGYQVQVNALHGGLDRGVMLWNFSDSPENVALTARNTIVGLWSNTPDTLLG
jgi:hypothetical protein